MTVISGRPRPVSIMFTVNTCDDVYIAMYIITYLASTSEEKYGVEDA